LIEKEEITQNIDLKKTFLPDFSTAATSAEKIYDIHSSNTINYYFFFYKKNKNKLLVKKNGSRWMWVWYKNNLKKRFFF